MLFEKKAAVKYLDITIDISKIPSIRTARLISVKGIGKLSTRKGVMDDRYHAYPYITQITLNDIPLLQVNSPGCSTSSSLLAAGYGLENVNCQELQDISESMNLPYVSLDTSIQAMEPMLTLLSSGLYIIADAICYPSDGNGAFFWDVSNEPVQHPATAMVLRPEEFVSGQPVYLYPTQHSNAYNEERVQYYVDEFHNAEDTPRAIAYNFCEFISFLLDGHHKACAAALSGKGVHCLVILPFIGYSYRPTLGKGILDSLTFSSLTIPVSALSKKYLPPHPKWNKVNQYISMKAGVVNERVWEKNYIDSCKFYPTVMEYAEMIITKISDDKKIADALLSECLANLNDYNQLKLKVALTVMRIQEDDRLKRIAISCIKQLPICELKCQACSILCTLEIDPEVEQLFIDYLVYCEDEHDILLPIIHSYWDSLALFIL